MVRVSGAETSASISPTHIHWPTLTTILCRILNYRPTVRISEQLNLVIIRYKVGQLWDLGQKQALLYPLSPYVSHPSISFTHNTLKRRKDISNLDMYSYKVGCYLSYGYVPCDNRMGVLHHPPPRIINIHTTDQATLRWYGQKQALLYPKSLRVQLTNGKVNIKYMHKSKL